MRNFLTKDVGWKVLSLALAVVIWYTVNALSNNARITNLPPQPSASMAFNDVPVLVVSSAADVRAYKVDPQVVQVIVKGNPDLVTELHKNEIHVVVDLTGIETAPYLKARVDVSVPPGVAVDRVVPAEVDVVVPPK